MTKLVSYILPVHNAAPHLRAAVSSVLAQTYSDIELIAIDDGSTDGSADILREFAARDSRVRVVSRENRGLVATLNEGLDLATGALIARMDGDDIAYPGRTAAQVAAFEANPQLAVVGMRVDYLYGGNTIIQGPRGEAGSDALRIESLFNCPLVHPTVMLNNDILKRKGYRYVATYPIAEDFELWRRILRDHPGLLLGEAGLAWRQHQSIRTRNFRRMMIDRMMICAENLNASGLADDLSIFYALTASDVAPNKGQLICLKTALYAVWAYRYHFAKTSDIYEQAFAGMLTNLLAGLTAPGAFGKAVTTIEAAGLGHLLTRHDRVAAMLGRVITPAGARAVMGAAHKLSHRLKTRPLTSVALPQSVLECL